MTKRVATNSVGSLNARYLCCGCGTCVGVCPQEAITLGPQPGGFALSIDDSCTECGLCLRVCPGLSLGPKQPQGTTRHSPPLTNIENLIGHYTETYLGHASDDVIRRTGTSGGVCTQLLIFCLQRGIIDAAIVTRMDIDSLQGIAVVAETPEQIIDAAKSKYCPTSPNVALREVRLRPDRKYAVVGLPCHIAGVIKAQAELSSLTSIVLRVGLFCSHSVTYEGLPFLLKRYGKGTSELASVSFRDEGWPGRLVGRYRDGSTVRIPLDQYWPCFYGHYFFTPYRCLSCNDLTAEQADLSLGDAWLPEVRDRDSVGTSLVVTRSPQAEAIVSKMRDEGLLELRAIPAAKVVEAQYGILGRKKGGAAARASLLKACGKPVPGMESPNNVSGGRLGAAMACFNAWFSTTRVGRWVLRWLPERVLRRYQGIVYRYSGANEIDLDQLRRSQSGVEKGPSRE